MDAIAVMIEAAQSSLSHFTSGQLGRGREFYEMSSAARPVEAGLAAMVQDGLPLKSFNVTKKQNLRLDLKTSPEL